MTLIMVAAVDGRAWAMVITSGEVVRGRLWFRGVGVAPDGLGGATDVVIPLRAALWSSELVA